jgi:hypothetical protein
MRRQKQVNPPRFEELRKACERYRLIDDPTYRVASLFIQNFWGNERDIADGLIVLLLVWNKAFYSRFGTPKPEPLAAVLRQRRREIDTVRSRNILEYEPEDDNRTIGHLYDSLITPLSVGKRQSPVAVAKALHLLSPHFLPPWDGRIARAYGCAWSDADKSVEMYLKFVQKFQSACQFVVQDYIARNRVDMQTGIQRIIAACCTEDPKKSLVKLIDEYNFIKIVEPTLRITKRL